MLADALKGKFLFSLFEEGCLLDYARANLRPTGEGDYTLASPPEVEAAKATAPVSAKPMHM